MRLSQPWNVRRTTVPNPAVHPGVVSLMRGALEGVPRNNAVWFIVVLVHRRDGVELPFSS